MELSPHLTKAEWSEFRLTQQRPACFSGRALPRLGKEEREDQKTILYLKPSEWMVTWIGNTSDQRPNGIPPKNSRKKSL